jgi:hypothetical protein
MKRVTLTFVTLSTVFLLATIVQPALAQTITVTGASQFVNDDTSGEYDVGVGQDTGDQQIQTNLTSGTFNGSFSQTISGSLGSTHGYISQNTTITNNGTTLIISGTLNSLNSSSATADDMGDLGLGGSSPVSTFGVFFDLDQPFYYKLDVNISRSMTLTSDNPVGASSTAYLQFGNPGAGVGATYGWSDFFPDDLYPKAGTTNGVLPAGSCSIEVAMDNSASFNGGATLAGNYSYDSSSTITFTLTVSQNNLLAPVITSFTPSLAGSYQLGWTAPQDGNYRIMSSPDLVNWSEAVSSASYSAGANVNLVDAVTDSNTGFYRVEYLGPSSP